MVRVRAARPDDRDAIAAVHEAAIRARGPAAYDDEQVAAWARAADEPDLDDGQEWIVAERDGEVVGFGRLALDDEGSAGDDDSEDGEGRSDDDSEGDGDHDAEDGGGVVAEVTANYVHPDHDRSGVGAALLAHCEGYARAAGAAECRVWASLNAVEFYERAGYRRTEVSELDVDEGVALEIVELRADLL